MFALNWTCRLQEELSIEVVELSQELEVLQEKLDRRRADEHQAALDDLLRRFNEQGGEADPEELLLQVRKLQHFVVVPAWEILGAKSTAISQLPYWYRSAR